MEQEFNRINKTLDRIEATLDEMNSDIDEIKCMVDKIMDELDKYYGGNKPSNNTNVTYDVEVKYDTK